MITLEKRVLTADVEQLAALIHERQKIVPYHEARILAQEIIDKCTGIVSAETTQIPKTKEEAKAVKAAKKK